MELISYVMAKLLYGISILLFTHIFLGYAIFTWERFLRYGLVGIMALLGMIYWEIPEDNIYQFITVIAVALMFSGSILRKICVWVQAQSAWWGVWLMLEIIFSSLFCGKTPEVHNYIKLMAAVFTFCLFWLGKKVAVGHLVVNNNTMIKCAVSVKQQLCMIMVSLEGDILFFVATFVYQQQICIFCNSFFISIILCIGGLYLFCFSLYMNKGVKKDYYKMMNLTLQEQIKSQFVYHQKLDQMTKETRAIRHDMKNHMIVLEGLANEHDMSKIITYIDNLQMQLNHTTHLLSTGNVIADSILNEKLEVAKNQNICMRADVALGGHMSIKDVDLCVILANSLDNAIEACGKIENQAQRDIAIYGRQEKGFLSFIISNSIGKSVYIVNNKVITDKLDKINHGYGLKNISNTIKMNKGKMKIECTEELFTLYIDIPCKSI